MGDPEETIDDIEGTGEEEEDTLEPSVAGRRLFGPSMVRMLVIVAAASRI